MADITITAEPDLVATQGPVHIPGAPGIKQGRVLITMDAYGNLQMKDDPKPGWADKFATDWQGETFLAISDKSIIEIVLSGQTNWQFDLGKGMLKFKNALNEQWYAVTYSPGQKPIKNILLHASPSGLKPDTDEARHSFFLMILIGQMSVGGAPGRPLGVAIDPDAKNPPPHGLMIDPSSPPVPVLSATV